MATIKLTYLVYKGRAELLRFILSQAGVDFEDKRIKPEKWAEEMPGKPLTHNLFLLHHGVFNFQGLSLAFQYWSVRELC